MHVHELMEKASADGITFTPDGGDIIVKAPTWEQLHVWEPILKPHKPALWQLLTAPEADLLADDSCPICGSRERWRWWDDRLLCRICLICDLAPLTLVRSGWSVHERIAT
jgi:hypothetical protein